MAMDFHTPTRSSWYILSQSRSSGMASLKTPHSFRDMLAAPWLGQFRAVQVLGNFPEAPKCQPRLTEILGHGVLTVRLGVFRPVLWCVFAHCSQWIAPGYGPVSRAARRVGGLVGAVIASAAARVRQAMVSDHLIRIVVIGFAAALSRRAWIELQQYWPALQRRFGTYGCKIEYAAYVAIAAGAVVVAIIAAPSP